MFDLMFRVKLAIDLYSSKQVAIKFLRVSPGISKHKALECLIKEVKILADCDNPHIAKILEASLDGMLVKQYAQQPSNSLLVPAEAEAPLPFVERVRRKSGVCYYAMRLAEYGEIYKFIEHTERFSERLARSLYLQLMQGLAYLHQQGVAHRDIKPENLLIDSKCRLIIADFGFAVQLPKD